MNKDKEWGEKEWNGAGLAGDRGEGERGALLSKMFFALSNLLILMLVIFIFWFNILESGGMSAFLW